MCGACWRRRWLPACGSWPAPTWPCRTGPSSTRRAGWSEYGLPEPTAIAALVETGRDAFGRPGLALGEPADLLLVDLPGGLAELGRPRLVLRHGRVVVDRR